VFTGIIETTGTITDIITENSNRHFWLSSPITHELRIDQSVSHNGVCLTVVEIKDNRYRVTAIDETLQKTTLGSWERDQKINLERCMPAHGRFDGHIVQGHVDGKAACVSVADQNGSWLYTFRLPDHADTSLVVDKGSICINGISLTVVSAADQQVSVAIIPYTYEFTNMHTLVAGSVVNIEYDILGKYIAKMMAARIH
jgi:riboflavin synthase